MKLDVRPLPAGLYVVATPIGSARDITLRALDILASADVIAAEDTRTLRKLMDIHGIPAGERRVVAYHDHSDRAATARLVAEVAAGRAVALVSEAGTPLVSDPGFELVRALREAGLPVTAAPGPSALVTALSIAGLPSDRFAFAGFLPPARARRKSVLAELRDTPFTLAFYESPKRISETLADMCEILGEDRRAVLCRELTKKFEEVRSGSLAELRDGVADDPPRGEIVLLLDRAATETASADDIDTALRKAMQTMRVKDAATAVAGALGLPRREVYQRALTLADEG